MRREHKDRWLCPQCMDSPTSIKDGHLILCVDRLLRKLHEKPEPATVTGGTEWSIGSIRGILQNEKYCGDVLRQKSFVNDCISRKHIRNVGQLPMYLTQDHHEGIPGESISLSDIDGCLADLDREFRELFAASKEDGGYLKYADAFKRITGDMAALKEKNAAILAQQESDSAANRRTQDAANILNSGAAEITEWQEDMIRQLVDTVRVLSADRIRVCLRSGMEIEQTIEGGR